MEWLIDDASHGQAGFSLARMTVLGGKCSQAHRHPDCNEALVLLEGACEAVLDGQTISMQPGQSVFVPQGSTHAVRNRDKNHAAVLLVCYSSGTRSYETA